MAKAAGNTAAIVKTLIEPVVESFGLSVWDVEYVREGANWYLRITIDSPNGIDISDCERVHRAIDPILDEADPIEDMYILEVSSPGLERVLRTPEHFAAMVGKKISLRLFHADASGMKQLTGTLDAYDTQEKKVLLTDLNGSSHVIGRDNISRACEYYDYDAEPGGEDARCGDERVTLE